MNNKFKAAVAATCLVMSSYACAQNSNGLSLVVNVASYHINAKQEFNQRNTGLGLEYKQGEYTYSIGGYKNSLWKHSNYMSVAYTPYHFDTPLGSVHVGGMAGLVSGYPELNKGRLGPMAGLVLQYENKLGANITLTVLPPVKSPVVIGLQLKYKF